MKETVDQIKDAKVFKENAGQEGIDPIGYILSNALTTEGSKIVSATMKNTSKEDVEVRKQRFEASKLLGMLGAMERKGEEEYKDAPENIKTVLTEYKKLKQNILDALEAKYGIGANS